MSTSVSGIQYFVFNDRKEVCFVTNLFSERMDSKVFRLQCNGVLREQSVPPLLPAYNKFMGAVDLTGQLKKPYGFDRKSKRSWFRLFVTFFCFAINKAWILFKHNCKQAEVEPKDQLAFCLELSHFLLEDGSKTRKAHPKTSVCYLKKVEDIGLKQGRCYHCQRTRSQRPQHTSFGCSVCKVRLCKIDCFAAFHRY